MTRAQAPAGGVTEQGGKREKWETEPREPIPSIELLQGMTLSDFRASGLVVVVRCALLGEEVVWAADDTLSSVRGLDDQGRVIYHGEELNLLLALAPHPEDLVAYHRMRKDVGRVDVMSLTHEPAAGRQETETENQGDA
jgi:hypothetical protein